ncbi:MAG: D-hexose-6-phosphate mutarotase [Thauera phenolivorans]|uniref:Putative glucose-6-phosphate 1-epimerase n=1 Tax=Thauera phenolivorans TaxID=1792543 RepID=A0A7X7R7M2_9RHOO|nr:D-hexose-6-phosphate mutarotase [Thauera phenolivorans]NLF54295.1 D-hexose-6-phosphate mutarotase [Thauera phenolivorans]
MRACIDEMAFRGLPALALSTAAGARAVVTLQGAQLVSWAPPGSEDRLWVSERAVVDGSAPLRGGVPVCFPQFATLGPLPRHGLLRTRQWELAGSRCGDDYALVILRCTDDEASRALWPHRFAIELAIGIENSRLDLELEVDNCGSASFTFTAALHSYLRVAEVEETRLEGLHGFDYRDATAGNRVKRDSGDALLIEGETDRVYREVDCPLLLREYTRSLGINSEGFTDVVIWNPWEKRCAELPDMAPGDFRRMLCVEAAVAEQPVSLAPGEGWWGRQTLIAL